MEYPFKSSSRGSVNTPGTNDSSAVPRQTENKKKEIRVQYNDPILFHPEPERIDESPDRPGNNGWFILLLTAETILAFLLLRWGAMYLLGGHPAEWDQIMNLVRRIAGQ